MFSEIQVIPKENGQFSVVEKTTTLSGSTVRTRTLVRFEAEGPVYRLVGADNDRIPVVNCEEGETNE